MTPIDIDFAARIWRRFARIFILDLRHISREDPFEFEIAQVGAASATPFDAEGSLGHRGTVIANSNAFPLTNEENVMTISNVSSINIDAFQQAIQNQTTQSATNSTQSADALAQLAAFQAQLQQSQAQQSSGQNVTTHHGHHHHGHHHGQSAAVGSTSATSSSTSNTSSVSQANVLSMMNAIPDTAAKSSGV